MTSDRLGNLLAVLATGLADEQRRAAAEATGLTDTANAVLTALDQFLDGARIGALADVTALTHSGAVRLTAQLVDQGLVRRVPLGDGREVGVRLTAKGRRSARLAAEARRTATDHLTRELSERQGVELERMLDRLVARLTDSRLDRRRAGGRDPWLCRTCDLAACGRDEGRCPAARTATGKS